MAPVSAFAERAAVTSALFAFKVKAAVTSALFAFKSNAACTAAEIGLTASGVLSTLSIPRFTLASASEVAPVPPPVIASVPPSLPAVSEKRA